MQQKYFRSYPASQDSSDQHAVLKKKGLLILLANRQLGIAWGLLLLTTAGNYAIFMGGTVTAEITPAWIRVEVVGKPR